MTSFDQLDLIEPIRHALRAENYTTPTPIQVQAIPHLLAGRDLLGCAQTGTGKTAAFALPILQRLAGERRPAGPKGMRALVLSPTRELALQIGESFRTYGRGLGLRQFVVLGGVGQGPQAQAVRGGIDILVATPGRLLDLHQQKLVRFDAVEIFVLDEADRMLDMGFVRDVQRIVDLLPAKRQSVFLSATMPREIATLAQRILRNPARVEVAPVATTVEKVEQRVIFVAQPDKRRLLGAVLRDPTVSRALVFTRTKHGANRVAEQLAQAGIDTGVIHGNKSQGARQKAIEEFRSGRSRALVATDIAARGIDIDGISHVVNYDLPNVPETYVHRIGRTARAGASGIAISFCDPRGEERAWLRDIEKLTRQQIPVADLPVLPGAREPAERERAARPAAAARPEQATRNSRPGWRRQRRRA